MSITYTSIRHSIKSPITMDYNATGVIPHRLVIYRKVKLFGCCANWQYQYGLILVDGVKRLVMRKMAPQGGYTQWELVKIGRS